eukprot:1829119-Prymnesium_polylepis.1
MRCGGRYTARCVQVSLWLPSHMACTKRLPRSGGRAASGRPRLQTRASLYCLRQSQKVVPPHLDTMLDIRSPIDHTCAVSMGIGEWAGGQRG